MDYGGFLGGAQQKRKPWIKRQGRFVVVKCRRKPWIKVLNEESNGEEGYGVC